MVDIVRQAPGSYRSEHFSITRENRKRNGTWWVIRAMTSAGKQILTSRECLSLKDAKKAVQAYERWTRAWITAHRPTIKRSRLATITMVAGEEKRTSKVIDHGHLHQWVGFGWVDEGAATETDFATYPTVLD